MAPSTAPRAEETDSVPLEDDREMTAMVEEALRSGLAEALPDALREMVRQRLRQLLNDDPTLAALRGAMKK